MAILSRNLKFKRVLLVFVFAALFVPFLSAADQGKSKSNSSDEEIKMALLLEVSKDKSIPDDEPPQLKIFANKIPLDEKTELMEFSITFKGLSNSYCRVGVYNGEINSAKIIPIPASAEHSGCLKYKRLAYVDINNDGVKDIIASISIPSNKYSAIVDEPIVYISSKESEAGYCYSTAAKETVVLFDLEAEIKKKSTATIDRLRKTILACSPQ